MITHPAARVCLLTGLQLDHGQESTKQKNIYNIICLIYIRFLFLTQTDTETVLGFLLLLL